MKNMPKINNKSNKELLINNQFHDYNTKGRNDFCMSMVRTNKGLYNPLTQVVKSSMKYQFLYVNCWVIVHSLIVWKNIWALMNISDKITYYHALWCTNFWFSLSMCRMFFSFWMKMQFCNYLKVSIYLLGFNNNWVIVCKI